MDNVFFAFGKLISSRIPFFLKLDVVAKSCVEIMLEFDFVMAQIKVAPLGTLLVVGTWSSMSTSIDQNLSICGITS